MQSKHIAIPGSEIERQIIEDWLTEQMTKDVAKQGWYVDVTMGFNGIASVIWDIACDYGQPGFDLNSPVVLGIAWLDTQRNVACWECNMVCWECNATEDLPPQSNDVGFGPVLPRVKQNSGAKGENLGSD